MISWTNISHAFVCQPPTVRKHQWRLLGHSTVFSSVVFQGLVSWKRFKKPSGWQNIQTQKHCCIFPPVNVWCLKSSNKIGTSSKNMQNCIHRAKKLDIYSPQLCNIECSVRAVEMLAQSFTSLARTHRSGRGWWHQMVGTTFHQGKTTTEVPFGEVPAYPIKNLLWGSFPFMGFVISSTPFNTPPLA